MSGRPHTLILASASPRRAELLTRLDLAFDVIAADIDEATKGQEQPPDHAVRIASTKAASVARRFPDRPVLGADTIVVVGDAILGKPRDDAEARAMLGRLSGRTHAVLTALALHFRGRLFVHLEQARVTFAPAPDELLDWYVTTGEPTDKAGAYAVQGRAALFIERVEGNVQAVVGLPLAALPGLLRQAGLALARDGDRLAVVESPALPPATP